MLAMRTIVLAICMVLVGACAFGQADGGLGIVESGVNLKLTAPIQPDGKRNVFLEVYTNDVYECGNFALENTAKVQGTKYTVVIKGVRRTQPCADGMAAASCKLSLAELAPGAYEVHISINRQIFRAQLKIFPDGYDFRIDDEDPQLIRIFNGHLNLIPNNTVWGKCEYTDPKRKQDALRFMAELQKAGAQLTQLPIGNYDEFYLHTPGTTEPKTVQGDRFEFPFVYSFAGDAGVLREIMNSFREQLKITLKTSKGQVFVNF